MAPKIVLNSSIGFFLLHYMYNPNKRRPRRKKRRDVIMSNILYYIQYFQMSFITSICNKYNLSGEDSITIKWVPSLETIHLEFSIK